MAPRSEEAAAWFAAVYQAVQEIPRGTVTSYGHIARLVGRPECPRQVGVSLKHLPSPGDTEQAGGSNGDGGSGPRWHSGNVPWQRVINSKGVISPRGPGGASRQAAALRREGVHVGRGSLGEYLVDLAAYGWFPSELPSEAAAGGEDSDSDSDASGARPGEAAAAAAAAADE
ncbi:mgmt family protein [Diplodia corticola]|uniref:Mgmt family protein n=1 Tax=Diplodia corticola TaxID=236234 RepID=A0A1J9RKH9_9PEZI|nr:mgmt family protein [Diplodia corticola]OJD33091.1 mgmt family protein [Diplodia corticola]